MPYRHAHKHTILFCRIMILHTLSTNFGDSPRIIMDFFFFNVKFLLVQRRFQCTMHSPSLPTVFTCTRLWYLCPVGTYHAFTKSLPTGFACTRLWYLMSCIMSLLQSMKSRILLLGDVRSTSYLNFSFISSRNTFCTKKQKRYDKNMTLNFIQGFTMI